MLHVYILSVRLQLMAAAIVGVALISFWGCSKKQQSVTPVVTPADTLVTIVPAIDPAVAGTIGFFWTIGNPKHIPRLHILKQLCQLALLTQ